jgi:RNA polymerase sigma factor (sigma-70 family)
MAFPKTRITLVQRLATGGSEDDWQVFFNDYWGPIFRFCLRRGAKSQDVAEEVTSDVFQVLWEKRLLERWSSNRSAKLRTLICSVARKLLSQRFRVKNQSSLQDDLEASKSEDDDIFYAAWAEDIVQTCIPELAANYRSEGKGDYVRVFYGRVCEGLKIHEVASTLGLAETKVDHHYRHVRDQLEILLKVKVRRHVSQYCPDEEIEAEFLLEWQQLGDFLGGKGSIEQAVADAYSQFDPQDLALRRDRSLTKTMSRVTAIRPASPEKSG